MQSAQGRYRRPTGEGKNFGETILVFAISAAMAGPMMSGYLISRPSLFAKPMASAAQTCARSGVEAVATYSYRRANFLAIFFLCVLVIVCLGGLYFAGDLSKFQRAFSVEESRTALGSRN
jgi:hypothetical protein